MSEDKTTTSREEMMVALRYDNKGTPTVWCDPEIADLVDSLNNDNLSTVASCSGHGVKPGIIALKDGRELLILPDYDSARLAERVVINALAQPAAVEPAKPFNWAVRERRNSDGELVDCFVEAPKEQGMAYGLEVLGDDYTGYGDVEGKLEHCKMIVAWANNAAARSPDVAAERDVVANCYSNDDGETWCDFPDDIEFVHGKKVGDEYELSASVRYWTERFRVVKVPDDESDEYEVEQVSPAQPDAGEM